MKLKRRINHLIKTNEELIQQELDELMKLQRKIDAQKKTLLKMDNLSNQVPCVDKSVDDADTAYLSRLFGDTINIS